MWNISLPFYRPSWSLGYSKRGVTSLSVASKITEKKLLKKVPQRERQSIKLRASFHSKTSTHTCLLSRGRERWEGFECTNRKKKKNSPRLSRIGVAWLRQVRVALPHSVAQNVPARAGPGSHKMASRKGWGLPPASGAAVFQMAFGLAGHALRTGVRMTTYMHFSFFWLGHAMVWYPLDASPIISEGFGLMLGVVAGRVCSDMGVAPVTPLQQ